MKAAARGDFPHLVGGRQVDRHGAGSLVPALMLSRLLTESNRLSGG